MLLLLLLVLPLLVGVLLAPRCLLRHASAVVTRARSSASLTALLLLLLRSHAGPEEKEIFNEILRVLKPGGLFLWGNALPSNFTTNLS